VKLRSWPEIGSDGDVLLEPYVPKGITGDDGDFQVLLGQPCFFPSFRFPEGIKQANGTIEGNEIWKLEGNARRFKTVQYIYIYIYI
jgi:hypothetical protein